MSKFKEGFLLVVSDFIFINVAWTFYYLFRIESGWIPYNTAASFLLPLSIVYLFWLFIFTLGGLYKHWFVRSRFEEFTSIVKTVSVGCFILFFLIFIDDALTNAKAISRYLILIYWGLMVFFVSIGRISIRSIQMSLLEKGYGLRNALIVGTGSRALDLAEIINKHKQLGYKIAGFISTIRTPDKNTLGNIYELQRLVGKHDAHEILIALERKEKELLLEIIKQAPHEKVHLKILPDTYEIVSGMVKTNQIYGIPLIEVFPEILPYTSKIIKRMIDVLLSVFLLVLFSPLWIFSILLIKLTSKGKIFYTQKRIGRNEVPFNMYKFRSMVESAEEYGPEWAGESDSRITKVGRLLRKLYIDEIPQLYNVLKNEMSIVGPRPERAYFVEKLKQEIPYYYKRMTVKPGITGWAQVKHKYDSSLDDVKVKLQYDFYYIENMSLKLDFKIMINTFLVILFMKGH